MSEYINSRAKQSTYDVILGGWSTAGWCHDAHYHHQRRSLSASWRAADGACCPVPQSGQAGAVYEYRYSCNQQQCSYRYSYSSRSTIRQGRPSLMVEWSTISLSGGALDITRSRDISLCRGHISNPISLLVISPLCRRVVRVRVLHNTIQYSYSVRRTAAVDCVECRRVDRRLSTFT